MGNSGVGNLRPAGRIRPATLLTSDPRLVSATCIGHPKCLVTLQNWQNGAVKRTRLQKKIRRCAAQIECSCQS